METGNYCYRYPHPAVSADCVLFAVENNEFKVLLIERINEPYKGSWAFPGGFMEIDESAEQCAKRELYEETNLANIHLEQLKAYTAVGRDPRERVITVAFIAMVDKLRCNAIAGDDAAKAQWFGIKNLPRLAFDHETIMTEAIEKLREMLYLALRGKALLPWNLSANEQADMLTILG